MTGQARQPGLCLDTSTLQFALACEAYGVAVSGTVDGRLIGCGGLRMLWTGVAEAWILLAADIQSYGMGPARVAKRQLAAWMKDLRLARIQAPLRANFAGGIRFAEFAGFQFEGRLRKYHNDGTDALMYAIIGEEQCQ